MSYLTKKLLEKIGQFGDGETEFYTGDIEHIINKLNKFKRQKNAQIRYLAANKKGVSHHRIQENQEQKEKGWDNAEKSFYAEWKTFDDSHLNGLLSSDSSGVSIKAGNKAKVVAATLMQWLGSNIGISFLERALAREGYKIVKIEEQ